MVVVSHLFLFYGNISGACATRMGHTRPCLRLSISRQVSAELRFQDSPLPMLEFVFTQHAFWYLA